MNKWNNMYFLEDNLNFKMTDISTGTSGIPNMKNQKQSI